MPSGLGVIEGCTHWISQCNITEADKERQHTTLSLSLCSEDCADFTLTEHKHVRTVKKLATGINNFSSWNHYKNNL